VAVTLPDVSEFQSPATGNANAFIDWIGPNLNDGEIGANGTNWSGCGFVDTSIYQGTLASLTSLGSHPPARMSAPEIEEEEVMQIQNDKKFGAVSFVGGQFTWIAFFCDPGGEVAGRGRQQKPGPGAARAGLRLVTLGGIELPSGSYYNPSTALGARDP
jgi:hypothetical protein